MQEFEMTKEFSIFGENSSFYFNRDGFASYWFIYYKKEIKYHPFINRRPLSVSKFHSSHHMYVFPLFFLSHTNILNYKTKNLMAFVFCLNNFILINISFTI
jgi:hypothetical protein